MQRGVEFGQARNTSGVEYQDAVDHVGGTVQRLHVLNYRGFFHPTAKSGMITRQLPSWL